MIPRAARNRFASVLEAEHLAEVPLGIREVDFFDEVPLYSRYGQVKFLEEYGDVDGLLLELALEYLQRVQAELIAGKRKGFIAITVVRDDVSEPIVPYIFVCNRNVRARLKNLHVSPPSRGLGKHVLTLMRAIDGARDYSVLEDRDSVTGDVKVFISQKVPPQGLMSLEALANGAAR